MTRPDDHPPEDWQARANEAARSVTALFGRRLFFLPGTHLGAVQLQATAGRTSGKGLLSAPWHYWWQAHYVDCLVDAGLRELGNGATPAARFHGPDHPNAGRLASRLVRSIRLRNAGTFVNNYYDDMAWLALASHRLDMLAAEARRPGRRRNARLLAVLGTQFDAACTADLGGGAFWSKARDFKNTPATAPVALFYARTGDRAKAQRLLDWLDAILYDPPQGLYLDGARLTPEGDVMVERAVYTYNQGPVLGALLEVGGEANLARASKLVAAVDRLLTVQAQPVLADGGAQTRVLRCEGTGDGGLFTGILCRYLALAALDTRLPDQARVTAARLVTGTAGAFWQGKRAAAAIEKRRERETAGAHIFSVHAAQPADITAPLGSAVELSTQLQAWMAIEAAARISALPHVIHGA